MLSLMRQKTMIITKADKTDLDTVKTITCTTIQEIYPHYYPAGAVEFFLHHHSDENIRKDIDSGRVYLCRNGSGDITGTVTVRDNEILRLFVLPEYQGNGCGRELLEYAERKIADNYDEIVIDASLCAKGIYLKRGYKETEYHTIKTDNGDFLCYDVMKKQI